VTEELLEGDMAKATIGDRALGMRLRQFRERAGVSLEYVAEVLDWSASTLSRFERGQRLDTTTDEVSAILAVLRVHGVERAETMKMLTCRSNQGVWEGIDPDVDGASGIFYTLEANASRLTYVQPFLVPGLLQTYDYYRVMCQEFGVEGAAALRRMSRRLGRQHLLTRSNPPDVLFVVNEYALRRPFGSQLLMAQQVRRIIAEVARPHTTQGGRPSWHWTMTLRWNCCTPSPTPWRLWSSADGSCLSESAACSRCLSRVQGGCGSLTRYSDGGLSSSMAPACRETPSPMTERQSTTRG
jgi:transcriptional regulator with XRE-family HTH domain